MHDLNRRQADRQQCDSGPVDTLDTPLEIRRIVDERTNHEQADDRERDVKVKDPRPPVIINQPAPDYRAKGWR
jgi:hypothetical protein